MWQRQTKTFGHDHGDKYSVLILDNRGELYFSSYTSFLRVEINSENFADGR